MNASNDNPLLVKPRRRWRRWVGYIGLLLLLVLAALAGSRYWNQRRLHARVAEVAAYLDQTDPGWRLEEIEAAREPIPEAENSARRVVAAADLLPHGWPPDDLSRLFQGLPLQERLAPDEADRLEAELERQKGALAFARNLPDLPRGRYRIEYAPNPMDTLLEDQQKARKVVALLGYDAMRHAQAGDLKQALLSCRAMLNGCRSLGDEPLSISFLIRTSLAEHMCLRTERVLAQGEPPPGEMEELQCALSEEIVHPSLVIAMRGERAVMHGVYQAFERGDVPLVDPRTGQVSWKERWLRWRTADRLLEEHPHMLRLRTEWIEIAELPLHEQTAAEAAFGRKLGARYPLLHETTLSFLASMKCSEAFRRKQARLRSLVAAIACERHRQEEGKWPGKLADLVPEYLPEVPRDPYDGKPIRLRRLPDGLVVYSVGPDRQDDGGALDRENPTQPRTDVGSRLWDVPARRQPPSPRPATPDDPLVPPE